MALAAAVTSLGGLGETLTAPATTGGFAAAGAVLLALAVIASEEIAVLPFLHGSHAARLLEAQGAPDDILDPSAPFANLALAAIGAAHQGVFDLDFRAQLLTLSPDAALMAGLPAHKATLSHSDWLTRLHPEDREIYSSALEMFRDQPGQAFRLEFRAHGQGGVWRWLELRASIVTEQDVPSDCLGLPQRHHRPQGGDAGQRRSAHRAGRASGLDGRHEGAGRPADERAAGDARSRPLQGDPCQYRRCPAATPFFSTPCGG